MARFVFKLEAVLRHRKNVEQQRQRELAAVHQQMRQLEDELRGIDQTMRDATAELRDTRLVGRLDMGYLAAHRRYALAMQRKGVAIAQRMALVQRELDEHRQRLLEAARQRKIVEKLRERHLQRWREDLSRRETLELDEIGMQLSYFHGPQPGPAVG